MIDTLVSAMDTLWLLINSVARIGIMLIVVYKLTRYRERFICPERIGLSMAGGAGFLTIPSIWSVDQSPFEGWAAALFALGFFIYLCGRLSRNIRHERNNRAAIAAAQARFERRGQ